MFDRGRKARPGSDNAEPGLSGMSSRDPEGGNRVVVETETYSTMPCGPLAAWAANCCWAVPARRRTSSSIEPKVCS